MPSISQQPSNVNTYHSQQVQAHQQTDQAQANQAAAEQNQAVQNTSSTEQPPANQDSSQAENRRNSSFEPGEIHFNRSQAQIVKPESQAEALKSAHDEVTKLRNQRIENTLNQLSLNQLSDEQLRHIQQNDQRDRF